MELIQKSLARIKEEAVFNIEALVRKKNDMVFWGAWLNNIGTLGNSIWKATLSKEALEKKEQRWKSMKAEDAEREFFWWLAGATFLQLGTWTAGFSYAEILWMQQVNFS